MNIKSVLNDILDANKKIKDLNKLKSERLNSFTKLANDYYFLDVFSNNIESGMWEDKNFILEMEINFMSENMLNDKKYLVKLGVSFVFEYDDNNQCERIAVISDSSIRTFSFEIDDLIDMYKRGDALWHKSSIEFNDLAIKGVNKFRDFLSTNEDGDFICEKICNGEKKKILVKRDLFENHLIEVMETLKDVSSEDGFLDDMYSSKTESTLVFIKEAIKMEKVNFLVNDLERKCGNSENDVKINVVKNKV